MLVISIKIGVIIWPVIPTADEFAAPTPINQPPLELDAGLPPARGIHPDLTPASITVCPAIIEPFRRADTPRIRFPRFPRRFSRRPDGQNRTATGIRLGDR
ncbi:MAG: hypothetical protein IPK63_20240 [Candidatus Competibacteraceae bacterium]|nr:hypothetical protein [Candidatus Competibacteraceae bacterium]